MSERKLPAFPGTFCYLGTNRKVKMLGCEILQQVLENHIVGFKAPRRQPQWSLETPTSSRSQARTFGEHYLLNG